MIATSVGKIPTTRMRRSVFSFAERTSKCYIRSLLQIGARDFFLVLRRGVSECQHVLSGLVHELSGFGEALRQRDCQVIPAAADTAYVFQGEHAAQGSGDHTLMVQQELRRKDKALAEAAALLIASKKIQAYWGEDEGD